MTLQTVIRRFLGAALAVSTLVLAGCGSNTESDPNAPLRVGMVSGPEVEVMKIAVAKAKAENNLDVELVEFQDYITPNIALSDGSVDINAYQHRPYLDSMIKDRGLKLVAIADTFVYPMAAYSDKITDIAQLKNGAKVAIPNDPSNEGRTLILLHNQGYIILKDVNKLDATPADIIENPRKLEFIELEAAQLPRSLPDVDIAFVNNTFAIAAGLTPDKALLVEDRKSPYMNMIVARIDNKDDPRIKQLVKAYQSDEVEQKAIELFKGNAIKGWD